MDFPFFVVNPICLEIYLFFNITHFVGQRWLPCNKQLFKHLPPKIEDLTFWWIFNKPHFRAGNHFWCLSWWQDPLLGIRFRKGSN